MLSVFSKLSRCIGIALRVLFPMLFSPFYRIFCIGITVHFLSRCSAPENRAFLASGLHLHQNSDALLSKYVISVHNRFDSVTKGSKKAPAQRRWSDAFKVNPSYSGAFIAKRLIYYCSSSAAAPMSVWLSADASALPSTGTIVPVAGASPSAGTSASVTG